MVYERLAALEQQHRYLELLMNEREAARLERVEERRRVDDEMFRRLEALSTAVNELSKRTQHHLMVQTCLNGGKAALQWGGAGGGVVAVAVLIGKLLGFW